MDTLRALSREFPGTQFYFIVGSDNLKEIGTWHRFRDVLARVILCVAHRPGYPLKIPRELRAGSIQRFPSPEMDMSSTVIRKKITQGLPFRHLVPKEVAEYISIRKLYKLQE
jgi:nicotinate-nucleotide adenylyltransferase